MKASCKHCGIEYKAWVKHNTSCSKRCSELAYRLRKWYGLTIKEYTDLLDEQDHRCKICGNRAEPEGISFANRSLNVDHCHDTGKVRGLICSNCNTGLGKFKDSPELIEKAFAYLIGE